MNNTACPLDCYDACEVKYIDTKIKASMDNTTKGYLCSHLNNYKDTKKITVARYKGDEISNKK